MNLDDWKVSTPSAVWLPPEVEEGNMEYKLKLVNLTQEQFNHRLTQMNWRLNEGENRAIYQIGYGDNGRPVGLNDYELQESLNSLNRIASSIDCTSQIEKVLVGEQGRTAQVLVLRREHAKALPENIPVAVVGAYGSGKSSLIGVLSSGHLDNGKGLSRTQVFQHHHEVISGRTSSITRHKLFFGDNGKVLNEGYDASSSASQQHAPSSRLRSLSDLDILTESRRIVTLIDLAGHEKYFKTTVFGLVSHSPLCCMLTVAAGSTSMAPPSMTLEHLGIAYVLDVPITIAVTKSDLCSPEALQETLDFVRRLLGSFKKEPLVMSSQEDVDAFLDQSMSAHKDYSKQSIIPIFLTSSVTGVGVSALRNYLFRLQVAQRVSSPPVMSSSEVKDEEEEEKESNHTEVRVLAAYRPEAPESTVRDDTVSENDTSKSGDVVIEGSVAGGRGVSVGDELYFGPFLDGSFTMVRLNSIHVNRVPVATISAGQTFTASIACNGQQILREEETLSPSPASVNDDDDDRNECAIHAPSVSPGLLESDGLSDMDSTASSIASGGSSGLALPPVWRGLFNGSRQGKFLLEGARGGAAPQASIEFDAEILILHHPNRIYVNYEPVVHIGVVRQTARLMSITKEGSTTQSYGSVALVTGDKAVCRFRFLYYPEYITVGSAVVLREGRTRGIGKIVKRYSNSNSSHSS